MKAVYEIPTYTIKEDNDVITILKNKDVNLIISVSDKKSNYLKLVVSDDKQCRILSDVYVTKKDLQSILR